MLTSFMNVPLAFSRDDGNGYWQGGRWFPGGTININALGSLQPFREGTSQTILPEGAKASDALWYWTTTLIQTVNQFTFTEADKTTVDGREYVAFDVENWSRHPTLTLNHYKTLLIRSDKVKNGEL